MDSLPLLAIEGDVVDSIDYDDVFDTLAKCKTRRKRI
jgi:hypothetical protein